MIQETLFWTKAIEQMKLQYVTS